jgi:hypothetical protein
MGTVIVGAIAGLVGGAIVSVVAPWVQWILERQRLTREGRVVRMEEWRAGLLEAEAAGRIDHNRLFLNEAWYRTLRPHLSDDEAKHLEWQPDFSGRVVRGTEYREIFALQLNDAIDRLAKAWDLP